MACFALSSSLRGSRAGIFDNVRSVQFNEPTRSGLNVVAVHVCEAQPYCVVTQVSWLSALQKVVRHQIALRSGHDLEAAARAIPGEPGGGVLRRAANVARRPCRGEIGKFHPHKVPPGWFQEDADPRFGCQHVAEDLAALLVCRDQPREDSILEASLKGRPQHLTDKGSAPPLALYVS